MNPADMLAQQQSQAQQTLIGATIGNYRVISKLGEGGMGAVYLGEHPLIGKKVAIKVLHDEFVSNPDVVSRFFNEAKAVNDIGHPNIAVHLLAHIVYLFRKAGIDNTCIHGHDIWHRDGDGADLSAATKGSLHS